MTGLKHIIKRLWAKLRIGKRSTTKRFKKAEHRCEEAECELSDMDRSSEDIQHQMLCPQESVDALTIQVEVAADTRASASTERVAALDSQLSKTQIEHLNQQAKMAPANKYKYPEISQEAEAGCSTMENPGTSGGCEDPHTPFNREEGAGSDLGVEYEKRVALYFCLVAHNADMEFSLATNVKGHGEFDDGAFGDVVFKFRKKGQAVYTTCYVHLKHIINGKSITMEEVLCKAPALFKTPPHM
jgi:hypothetical protein